MTEAEAEAFYASKWESVHAEVVDHTLDPENAPSAWHAGIVEFRLGVETTDGNRYGFGVHRSKTELDRFPEAYGITLDRMVAKVDEAIRDAGRVAR